MNCDVQPLPVSFETVQSTDAPSIFSDVAGDNVSLGSNDTSMMEALSQESQDLLPTQDLEDEDFIRSFTESNEPPGLYSVTDLDLNTPFKIRPTLPEETPFWWSWEIHRVADHLGILPRDLHARASKRLFSTKPKANNFWDVLRAICLEDKAQEVPMRSELHDWTSEKNQYYNEESNQVISFKGRLEWSNDISKGLFKSLQLSPFQVEQSCRFQRKFGADRFLVVSSPILSECPLATNPGTPTSKQALHDIICEWLSKRSNFIAGRYWRFLFTDQDKARNKKKEQRGGPRLKLFFFAESGLDIVPRTLKSLHSLVPFRSHPHCIIKVEDLLEWHMPLRENYGSTDLKGFSRISLGYSKTTPTIPLQPYQFLSVRDTLGAAKGDGSREIMNDGCARMSLAYAQAIWTKYGGTNAHELPSVVQGRISGAKGLWIVDYEHSYAGRSFENDYWIEVSDSQLKIKPHPADRHDADESQRTFEVLKYASATKAGHLNIQLITVLENGGVPRKVFEDALVADTSEFSDTLIKAMKNRHALRAWVQEYAQCRRAGSIRMLGSFPAEKADQVNCLLDSGFEPRDNAMLIDGIQKILSDYLTNYIEKLWIKIPHSTVVFCAPDPYGILRPGHVYLGFSQPIEDPRNGVSEFHLNDLKVLVARNPAYLASDIQMQTAVYEHRLRHYKDVILFSTQGETPLASLLSGGDYDGDTVNVIWDPEIVKHFQSINVPQLPTESDCHLTNKSRPLSQIFQGHRASAEEVSSFLQGCIQFNSCSNLMGSCSSEHEKLVYFLSLERVQSKLSHFGALKLAALAGYLVDANKQGWSLEDKAWHSLRREAQGGMSLKVPAYKDPEFSPRKGAHYENVIDFLKYEVAKKQELQALRSFRKAYSIEGKYDTDLSALWHKYSHKSTVEVSKNASVCSNCRTELWGSVTLKRILIDDEESLSKKVKLVDDTWTRLSTQNNNINLFIKSQRERKDFAALINDVYGRFRTIEPPPFDHMLCHQHEDEKDYPFSNWALLRASYLYYLACHRGAPHKPWLWYVAGPELCYLKAREQGRVRVVVDSMYNILKVDTKLTRRLLEDRIEIIDEGDRNPGLEINEDEDMDDD